MNNSIKNEPIFKIENITLRYNKNDDIVKNLSLDIYRGEFVSIIGPNGSGKSTVLRAMAKILKPKKGNIFYNGREINLTFKKYLYEKITKLYKIPISLVTDEWSIINEKEEQKIEDNFLKQSYYFAKMWEKAKKLGFNVGDLIISQDKLPFNKILEKTMKFARTNGINLIKDVYFKKSFIETDIDKLTELKKINIEQYQITILNNYAFRFNPKENELIFSNKVYKNKYVNKISNYLRSKKINIDKNYFMTDKNNFLDYCFINHPYVICSLKRLLKWKKFFHLDNNIPLYSFNDLFYSSKEYAKYVSFVPQITNFPHEVTVEEFVKMGRYPYNKILSIFDNELDKKIINNALENVNLLDLKDKYIDDLSGGQKQRAIIALALAQDTDTILLDEPTNHLDIKHQLEIIHLLHDLNHKLNKTIILVIHDINHGMKFSDKIAIMNHGKIVSYGPTNKIINKKIIKDVFGVDAKVELSQNKKIITDYWIDDLDLLKNYHEKDEYK
ncbi:ATP-binding cassette domain-containing protein [Malacoplasma muris]|uniref:ATP-binding cassette domain-containing protein n=1 Tax=Malacoplasma muris TaxID=2119 RepID=UPI00398F30A2